MSTNRIDKVNSLFEREISQILLRDFHFAESLVTLTHVDVTPNLIEARAYISVMFTRKSSASPAGGLGEGGPEKEINDIIKRLNDNVGDIQQKINKKVNMRPVPRIMFLRDDHTKEAGRVEELLNKLRKDQE